MYLSGPLDGFWRKVNMKLGKAIKRPVFNILCMYFVPRHVERGVLSGIG